MITKIATISWFLVFGISSFWAFPAALTVLGVLALIVAISMMVGA